MTTTTHSGSGFRAGGLRLAAVRPAHFVSRRLRVVGAHGRLQWWHRRMTLGLTLAGAMIGALLGVGQAFLTSGIDPRALLEAYGATAGAGASLGLVLGLVLGLLFGVVDRYLMPQSVRPRRVWMRYRRD